jgi:hypothetical protein
MTAASAVLRVGCHAPVPLHGTPAVAVDCHPGEVTVILGYDSHGQPVTLTITSIEWADDLTDAGGEAAARGIVRAGMIRPTRMAGTAVTP